jgi:hypothetical protein
MKQHSATLDLVIVGALRQEHLEIHEASRFGYHRALEAVNDILQ